MIRLTNKIKDKTFAIYSIIQKLPQYNAMILISQVYPWSISISVILQRLPSPYPTNENSLHHLKQPIVLIFKTVKDIMIGYSLLCHDTTEQLKPITLNPGTDSGSFFNVVCLQTQGHQDLFDCWGCLFLFCQMDASEKLWGSQEYLQFGPTDAPLAFALYLARTWDGGLCVRNLLCY